MPYESSPHRRRPTRRKPRSTRWVTACAVAAIVPAMTPWRAEASDSVVRVEQDWRLVLNEPNDDVESPQLHTYQSLTTGTKPVYVQVCWNYHEYPDFVPGGVQIQLWYGDQLLLDRSVTLEPLSAPDETITWTQVLEINGSDVSFRIVDGQSATWGAFGGGDMQIEVTTTIPNLDGCTTQASVDESLITYGSNRVESLTITEVRRYRSGGTATVDSAAHVVFALNGN